MNIFRFIEWIFHDASQRKLIIDRLCMHIARTFKFILRHCVTYDEEMAESETKFRSKRFLEQRNKRGNRTKLTIEMSRPWNRWNFTNLVRLRIKCDILTVSESVASSLEQHDFAFI